MESVDLMERDSVWIPLTPGKSIPATYQATLPSEQGTGKESINKLFPCIDSLDTMKYMDDSDSVMIKLSAGNGILDDGYEVVLHVAEKDDPKPTKAVQYDTSSVQEEAVKVPLSEPVHESQAGVDSIPTPSKSNYSRKRCNKDIDL